MRFVFVAAKVVGMSGGAYSLLGQQLGDVLLNWERKSAPYRPFVGTSYLELGTDLFQHVF